MVRVVNWRLAFEADEWGVPVSRGPKAGSLANRHQSLWIEYTLAELADGRRAVTVVSVGIRWHSESASFVADCALR